MSKFVSWYIVELDCLLRNQIPADRLHSLLNEVENHLNEAIAEREARGMSRDEAELATLEAMGSPEKMAEEELKLAGASPRKSAAYTATLVATGFLCVGWLIGSLLPDKNFHSVTGLVFVLALPVLLFGGFVAQRINWRLFWVAAACGAVSLAIHQGTRHVYFGEQEFLVENAQALVAESGVVTPSLQARNEVLRQELAKPMAQRFAQRLPGAIVGLTAIMGITGGFVWLFTRLPRKRSVHWLKQRLA